MGEGQARPREEGQSCLARALAYRQRLLAATCPGDTNWGEKLPTSQTEASASGGNVLPCPRGQGAGCDHDGSNDKSPALGGPHHAHSALGCQPSSKQSAASLNGRPGLALTWLRDKGPCQPLPTGDLGLRPSLPARTAQQVQLLMSQPAWRLSVCWI